MKINTKNEELFEDKVKAIESLISGKHTWKMDNDYVIKVGTKISALYSEEGRIQFKTEWIYDMLREFKGSERLHEFKSQYAKREKCPICLDNGEYFDEYNELVPCNCDNSALLYLVPEIDVTSDVYDIETIKTEKVITVNGYYTLSADGEERYKITKLDNVLPHEKTEEFYADLEEIITQQGGFFYDNFEDVCDVKIAVKYIEYLSTEDLNDNGLEDDLVKVSYDCIMFSTNNPKFYRKKGKPNIKFLNISVEDLD